MLCCLLLCLTPLIWIALCIDPPSRILEGVSTQTDGPQTAGGSECQELAEGRVAFAATEARRMPAASVGAMERDPNPSLKRELKAAGNYDKDMVATSVLSCFDGPRLVA